MSVSAFLVSSSLYSWTYEWYALLVDISILLLVRRKCERTENMRRMNSSDSQHITSTLDLRQICIYRQALDDTYKNRMWNLHVKNQNATKK